MKQSFLELLTLGLSECIGTAMLLFFGCMGCVDLGAPGFPTHLSICLGMKPLKCRKKKSLKAQHFQKFIVKAREDVLNLLMSMIVHNNKNYLCL